MKSSDLINTTPIEQFVDNIGVNNIFGAPVKEGDTTIIPIAQAEVGFGYGGGYGHAPSEDEATSHDEAAEGGGSGGGAGGRTTPRGYLHITPEGVSYKPIMDEMRIPLAGILLGAWTVFWIMATVRSVAKSVAAVKKSRSK